MESELGSGSRNHVVEHQPELLIPEAPMPPNPTGPYLYSLHKG